MCGIVFLRYVRVKINIAKWIHTKGYTYTLFLFMTTRRWQTKKKRGPRRSSKITNKAPMSFIVFVIIDHQSWSMITKTMKLIWALFDKLCLAARASFSTSLMMLLTSFFSFFVVMFRHVHVRTAVAVSYTHLTLPTKRIV